MVLFLLLFSLALGAASPTDQGKFVSNGVKLLRGGCPMFWYSFNGRCYKYVSTRLSWGESELHCVSQGANLVSIFNEQQHEFVKTLVKNFDHTEGWTWIGLSDAHKEGGWMWSDGCAVNYTSWGEGLPNNSLGVEDCAHINHGQLKRWDDVMCSDVFPSVCATRVPSCP